MVLSITFLSGFQAIFILFSSVCDCADSGWLACQSATSQPIRAQCCAHLLLRHRSRDTSKRFTGCSVRVSWLSLMQWLVSVSVFSYPRYGYTVLNRACI